jgi:hypothetical protein
MADNFDWASIDWADRYPRLLIFAAGKLKRLRWRGEPFGAIPGAATPKDVVHDAIVKTISGVRQWNRTTTSLFDHLVGVISSNVSHLVQTAENRRTLRADEKILVIEDIREDPETTDIRRLQEQKFLSYLENKRPVLRQLAESILNDPAANTTLELAIKFNLSIRQTESLKTSLRRATKEFLEKEQALKGKRVHTDEQALTDCPRRSLPKDGDTSGR